MAGGASCVYDLGVVPVVEDCGGSSGRGCGGVPSFLVIAIPIATVDGVDGAGEDGGRRVCVVGQTRRWAPREALPGGSCGRLEAIESESNAE